MPYKQLLKYLNRYFIITRKTNLGISLYCIDKTERFGFKYVLNEVSIKIGAEIIIENCALSYLYNKYAK